MAIVQTLSLSLNHHTVICTRDKDLRQVPGLHYGWECGAQPEYRLRLVGDFGALQMENKKLVGTGLMFFYAQVLMGDAVDNIPGLPQFGPAKTFSVLQSCKTEWELYSAVKARYEEYYADIWEEELMEQAQLVWMVRELDSEGNLVMWEPPKEEG
jgi:5'-3' exonuclease